jgi:hypothetical protein
MLLLWAELMRVFWKSSMKKTDYKKQGNEKTIDYYEAVRIAYIDGQYLRKYLDFEIKDIGEVNKSFRSIWGFTYKIVSGEEKQRIKVVNKDPDNLLVQWVPGGKTITEMLREMSVNPRRL